MKTVVGVIGIGLMGGAMSEVLCEAGRTVVGYDIKPEPRRRLRRAGGRPLASSTAVASSADFIITSLPDSEALADVVDKIAAARRPRVKVVIEMSTLPIADKQRGKARLRPHGITLLDCPVSGTVSRLRQGTWTIYRSGPAAAAKSAVPVLAAFTKSTPYVGAFGNGMRLKFLANHLLAINLVAIGESLAFARKMGIDAKTYYDMFASHPVYGTVMFKLRGGMMVERNYLPAQMKMQTWQKDMRVIGDMARIVGCPAPLFSATVPFYNAAMAQGLDQQDTAAVFEVLNEMAALEPPRKRRA